MTFDSIMERMLSRVPNDLDTREGSVIWDALAPCAYELAQMYLEVEEKHKDTFAGTATREWLIKRCAEIGIAPHEATYAVRKGVFTPDTLNINLGTRFNFDELNFVVIEKLADGEYALQCETKGTDGNFGTGTLIPIHYVNGLETATLTSDTLIYGEDDEDTEDLRARYFATLPTMTLDGNVGQYSKWCREYAGIGNFKIFPEWDGKNTVKVSILSSENTVASDTLIDDFQEYLDPESEGLGMGKAPIGAIVTVTTAEEVPINISASVMLKVGYDAPVGLNEDIESYLVGLNYNRTNVSYVAISAVIQNNESVDTVWDVIVNDGREDIALGDEQIVKLGTTDFEVTQ